MQGMKSAETNQKTTYLYLPEKKIFKETFLNIFWIFYWDEQTQS